jgi:hypothetical protein
MIGGGTKKRLTNSKVIDFRSAPLWELPTLSLDQAKDLMSKDFGIELVKLAAAHMTHFTFGVGDQTGVLSLR